MTEMRVWTAYAPDNDITYIMEEEHVDGKIIVSVSGFYYGQPNEADTQAYRNNLVAEFEECESKMSNMTNHIYDIYMAACEAQDMFADWAYQAIRRYVYTDRASAAWSQALLRANPHKLIAYVAQGKHGADDIIIKRTTSYLKRYCRLGA